MTDSTVKLIMDKVKAQITANITLVDATYWGESNITNEDVNIWVDIEVTDVLPKDPNEQGVNTEVDEDWVISCIIRGQDHDEVCQVVESLQLLWQKQDNTLMAALIALKPNSNDVYNMTWGGKQYPSNVGKDGFAGVVQFVIAVRFYFPA